MEDQWEYLTQFVFASIDSQGVKEFFKGIFPPGYKPPKYSPQAMIPELNSLGEEGWELVHMQPVAVGDKLDVRFNGEITVWSNAYFCVFKRRIIN